MLARPTFTQAVAILATVIAFLMIFATSPEENVLHVAAIAGLAIVFFATRVVPETLTSIWCFLAFIALGVAPPDVIFSGFATGGFWLLFSGLIIGGAIGQTGLGKRLAEQLFARTGESYARATVALAITGLALGFLIPSTIPRIIILVPISAALASAMGYASGSRPAIGLSMTAASSTLLPTYSILTANLPTIVHYGALETLYGLPPSYADYFIEQVPVNAIRFAVILVFLLAFARGTPASAAPEAAPAEPMTGPQLRLLTLLGGAILFWATDTLHGISPAWIALTVASIVLLPAMGMLTKDALKTSIDLSPAIYVAGVFAVSAVAMHTGVNDLIADTLIPRLGLGQGSTLRDLYAVSGFSMVVSHLTTAPAAPLILAPLAESTATAVGWPIHTVAMAQIIGISTPLLPYQAPPLVLAMALSGIPAAALTRLCVALALGVYLLGIPVTYAWWNLIGIF